MHLLIYSSDIQVNDKLDPWQGLVEIIEQHRPKEMRQSHDTIYFKLLSSRCMPNYTKNVFISTCSLNWNIKSSWKVCENPY